ncbi:glycerophosphodiester phosphodiesterase [Alkalibacter sp. M17DMB]|nr:glycerophosphodiester phosphodiesterase [Alkalibacter mobilis]
MSAFNILILSLGFVGLKRYLRSVERLDYDEYGWLVNEKIAHRGIHDNNGKNPENSLKAFELAIEKGWPIELDVGLTSDEKVVVIHDKKLVRLLGLNKDLRDITYDELSKRKILKSDEIVPLLSDVLDLVNGKIPILIEIKSDGKAGKLEELLLVQLKSYKGKYAIQSFDPLSLKWFRDNSPEIVRGQLSGDFEINDYEKKYQGEPELPLYQKLLLRNLLLNFMSRPNFIAYQISGTSFDFIRKIKRLGVPVLGWTVKDKIQYEKVKGLFDNIITDDTSF